MPGSFGASAFLAYVPRVPLRHGGMTLSVRGYAALSPREKGERFKGFTKKIAQVPKEEVDKEREKREREKKRAG
jgi:hypothetical protein